jgi:hypothetical protein
MDTLSRVLLLGESLYLLAIQADLEKHGVETRLFDSNTTQEGLTHFMEIWRPDFVLLDEDCPEMTLKFILWQPGINVVVVGGEQDLTVFSGQSFSMADPTDDLLQALIGVQPNK